MRYVLQYRYPPEKGMVTPRSMFAYKERTTWKDWGYETSYLDEMKQKMEYAKKAVGSGIELRYIVKGRNSFTSGGVSQVF